MFYGFAGSGRLYDFVIKRTIPSRWRRENVVILTKGTVTE